MDFYVRQTPSFGLASSAKHGNAAAAVHVEYANTPEHHSQSDRNSHRDRHYVHNRIDPPSNRIQRKHHEPAQDNLPFIPAAEVQRADGTEGSPIWIVIDDIVYDVTEFVKRHPGGEMPLRNFGGKSCSWQFHKIHSNKTLELHGGKLRIGRTGDVPNSYKEPKSVPLCQLWKSPQF